MFKIIAMLRKSGTKNLMHGEKNSMIHHELKFIEYNKKKK